MTLVVAGAPPPVVLALLPAARPRPLARRSSCRTRPSTGVWDSRWSGRCAGWRSLVPGRRPRRHRRVRRRGGRAPRAGLGGLLRRTQNGSVQGYLMVVVVGAAAIAVVAGVLS